MRPEAFWSAPVDKIENELRGSRLICELVCGDVRLIHMGSQEITGL